MGKGIKKSIIALIILGSCLVLFSSGNPKVLLVARESPSVDIELMLTQEVGVMLTILREAGYQVVVATESGSPLTSETVKLKPDLTLDEVDIDEYEGIIMPCMGISFSAQVPSKAVELVKQAVSSELPIAAQVSSLFILAEAKALLGKKFALHHDFAAQGDTRFDGAHYMGLGVVQDGNIVTSGTCPFMAKTKGLTDGTPELTNTFIKLIQKK